MRKIPIAGGGTAESSIETKEMEDRDTSRVSMPSTMQSNVKYDNFDEYRAAQVRRRNKQANLNTSQVSSPKSMTTTTADDTTVPRVNSSGSFIEKNEIQLFIIALLVIDTFLAFTALALQSSVLESIPLMSSSTLKLISICKTLVKSICTFCSGVFICEAILLLFSFHYQYFLHFGYILDTIVLTIQSYAIYANYGLYACKILNIFRIWRCFRLFASLIQIERDMRMLAVAQMEDARMHARTLELDVSRMSVELLKERESHKSMDTLLHSYKDEIDTLNEALKIAAQDIAEAAQDDFSGDDEGDFEMTGDENDDRVSSKTPSLSGSTTLLFRVNEDGSFEHTSM